MPLYPANDSTILACPTTLASNFIDSGQLRTKNRKWQVSCKDVDWLSLMKIIIAMI